MKNLFRLWDFQIDEDLQKKEMVDFIYSKEIQELLLKENYMWPINIKEHDYAELRTLKTLKDL